MKKTFIVLKENYLRQIKSWSFITLVLAPFAFLIIMAGISYLEAKNSSDNDQIAVIRQVKKAPLNSYELKKQGIDVTSKYANITAAKKALKKDKIRGYLTAKTESSQVKVTYVGSSNLDNSEKQGINNIVGKYQQILNIRQSGINNKQLKTLTRKPSFKQKIQNSSHASSIKEISTMILIFVMYFILTTYASITAQEIASEKGSKIMEIIFSSMKAIRYFYGKILAVFCVIITHLAIYFVGGWIFFEVAARTKSLAPIIKKYKPLIDGVIHNLVSSSLLYVILGVIIYTILSALCGALVSRAEDASKATQPTMVLTMVGFFGALSLQQSPNNLFVRIFSYVPFTSSFFMPIRLVNGTVSPLENTISLVILVVTIVVMLIYIGKIYGGLVLQTDDIGLFKSLKRGISTR